MNRKIIVLFLCSFALKVNAQDNWTLKQCIDYGLKNNRNNTIYANEKRAADAKAKEALADYLPRVSLTSTLDDNLKLQQTVIPAGIFGPNDVKVSLSKQYSSNATAQLDQVIYDQSMLTGLKANKYNRQQAELNIQQSQEAIIYNISTAWFQIFVYRQQLELLQVNKETYEKQIAIYRLQVSKGTALQKDQDKVTVDYNNTVSQIRVAESNLQLAENELKYEMGYPINEPLAVDTSAGIKIPAALPEDSAGAFSPTARVDYRLSQVNIQALQIEQARIRAEALPKLTAYARYGAVGFGNNLKESYSTLLPFSAVGLKLTIPILDFYKRNAQYKQAEINRINAEEKLKLAEGQYKMEYENNRTKLLQAQANVENDQRNIALAESVLKVTDLQFQKGITDLTDWLNTQHSLKEAQNSYLNSLYNYYLAKIDLEKAAGTLKTFYNSL
ncbi:Outer membrane protein TolC [Chitinophaga rupis]|uniref:Outer membrane protein TolC n=1 Tax=Chitinophaga rupis TaxID=573321 RepID=A0A1H8GNT5_9BACT|nr:TolC family protein [Chitinophaga rupis]SEN45465.1 Outer membrane protein TolC [Chitinophaga rupis]